MTLSRSKPNGEDYRFPEMVAVESHTDAKHYH